MAKQWGSKLQRGHVNSDDPRRPKMTDMVIFLDHDGYPHAAVVIAVRVTVALNEAEDDLDDSHETLDLFVFDLPDGPVKVSCVHKGTMMSDRSYPRSSWHWPA
jgi:hypothetical protein